MNRDILNKLNDYTLLFVENEKGILENYGQFFGLLFGEVYTAPNGIEALKHYNSVKPDLIITDIKMPLMDGITLAKTIRQKDLHTAIILISAHTEVEMLLQSIPLGLVDYVVKPLSESKLIAVLEKFLALKQPKNFFYDSTNSYTVVDGITYTLSHKENIFLEILIEQKRLITYSEIESQVYQHKDMSQNALRLFIKNLRKKLPKDYLLNVTNIGYKINPDLTV